MSGIDLRPELYARKARIESELNPLKQKLEKMKAFKIKVDNAKNDANSIYAGLYAAKVSFETGALLVDGQNPMVGKVNEISLDIDSVMADYETALTEINQKISEYQSRVNDLQQQLNNVNAKLRKYF